MAQVHIKLFLALMFLVGVGFCQNATNTTEAPATPPVPASTSATSTTPRPTVTNSLFNMVTAVPMGFIQACKFGLTAFGTFIKQLADHKKF